MTIKMKVPAAYQVPGVTEYFNRLDDVSEASNLTPEVLLAIYAQHPVDKQELVLAVVEKDGVKLVHGSLQILEVANTIYLFRQTKPHLTQKILLPSSWVGMMLIEMQRYVVLSATGYLANFKP